MKITKRNVKKHARRIKHATEGQLDQLQGNYQKLIGGVRGLDTPLLIIISVVGIAGILLFDAWVFDFIGLIVLLYPFYLFAEREGHQEGYFEGSFEHMSPQSSEEQK
jgi:hypothetical protein